MRRALLLLFLALAALSGCDRNVQPYVPGEEPRQPDLSRIFPAGAEEAARRAPAMELPPAPPARGAAPVASASEGKPIRGVISVAETLAGRIPPGAVLYLMARTGPGGPPLAAKRFDRPQFPLRFEIGPGDRMIPTIPFAGRLQLSARLDGDGDAVSRTPGDLQGRSAEAVEPGAEDVRIVLDEVL